METSRNLEKIGLGDEYMGIWGVVGGGGGYGKWEERLGIVGIRDLSDIVRKAE
jgi:hypothetical protein